MKVFSCQQIGEIDAYTIKHEPISSIGLMERASLAIFRWFAGNISSDLPIYIFAGNGNNGGDGIALTRTLYTTGYNVQLYLLKSNHYTTDNQQNITLLAKSCNYQPTYIDETSLLPNIPSNAVVVDALFGSGLSRPLEGFPARVVEHINKHSKNTIAIDLPSGLFGEENPYPNRNTITKATTTLTFQFPKRSFFFSENNDFVGNWYILPIELHPDVIANTETLYNYIDDRYAKSLLLKREKFAHKGKHGHALIVAGSKGMMGASVICTSACVLAGAGLVTAHVPRVGLQIIQQYIPEALVSIDEDSECFTHIADMSKCTAIGIGCGLGTSSKSAEGLKNLLQNSKKPFVIDADGLNLLARNSDMLNLLPKETIITPHVGEFERLFGQAACSEERLRVAQQKSKVLGIIIVLKGAYTQVVCPDGTVFFNSTGNPGMASGGSGDALTGIITSLLAQGYPSYISAILGVYLHGLAGDLASRKYCEHSVKASHIVGSISDAISYLENWSNF